jgi:prevent-host-death family protein
MGEQTVQASVFKAHVLSLLDQVAQTHTSVLVTKHGRPVARLVPVDQPEPTMGSVSLLADADDQYFSTGETWHAAS